MVTLQSMFDLSGRTALVTGCDRGIDQAMTIALAEAGADIIGVSRHLDDECETTKAIRALNRSFKAYQTDLSERDNLYAFIHAVKQENPPVDVLINNAGIILRKPALEHSDEY